MPAADPEEFRRDVVRVARKGETPLSQIAKDFSITEGTLSNWLKRADIDDGVRPGVTTTEAAELREVRSATSSSSRRTRSSGGRRPTSPSNCPQNEVPAGPRPCC